MAFGGGGFGKVFGRARWVCGCHQAGGHQDDKSANPVSDGAGGDERGPLQGEVFAQNTASFAGIAVPILDAFFCSSNLHKEHKLYRNGQLIHGYMVMPLLNKTLNELVGQQTAGEGTGVTHGIMSPGLSPHMQGKITQSQLDQLRKIVTIAHHLEMLPRDAHYSNFMSLGSAWS